MKLKSVYIYLGVLIVIALLLIISSFSSKPDSKNSSMSGSEMLDDEIHGSIDQSGGMPSLGNVSTGVMNQLETLKKDYEENPKDTAKTKLYADMLNSAHQSLKALELYDSILKIDPNRIDILLGSTFSYYNLNDLDKAEEYTKTILDLDQNNEEANFNLGAIAAARGNKEKAREYWNNVIKQFPNSHAAKIAENSLKKL